MAGDVEVRQEVVLTPSSLTTSFNFQSAGPGGASGFFAASWASFVVRAAALYETPKPDRGAR
jgi:hypothetical protein